MSRVIIAGGRDIESRAVVIDAINNSGFEITEVVCGCCPTGVDRIGERWGDDNEIRVTRFAPDWKQHGNAAGPIRNAAMAGYADALILVWDGRSKGSASMLREAKRRELVIHEVIVPTGER